AGSDMFLAKHFWNKEKVCVIENGVYIPESSEIKVREPIRFGSVGRMVQLKGQHFLLRAFKEIDRKLAPLNHPYELHFFGSGPEERSLKAAAEASESNSSIYFHGTVIDREKIYSRIDVLIVSSVTEGLSLVIMEAMARGICVIAT